jgi:hypothetical protein
MVDADVALVVERTTDHGAAKVPTPPFVAERSAVAIDFDDFFTWNRMTVAAVLVTVAAFLGIPTVNQDDGSER